jgi:hypothetical protein
MIPRDKSRSALFALATGLAAGALVTACGGDDSSSDTDTTTATTGARASGPTAIQHPCAGPPDRGQTPNFSKRLIRTPYCRKAIRSMSS